MAIVSTMSLPKIISAKATRGGVRAILTPPRGFSSTRWRFYLFALSRISTRRILPLMVFGSSSTNSTTRGYL